MYAFFYTFIENMAFIITFMFLGLKLQEALLKKYEQFYRKNSRWLIPLFYGFLSIWVMTFAPFQFDEAQLDLRSAPIFLISYLGGWRLGFLSSILSAVSYAYIGDTTIYQGLIQGIVLPLAVGAVFYHFQKRKLVSPYKIVINKRELIPALMFFTIVQALILLFTTSATLPVVLMMMVFTFFAVFGMSMMINDMSKINLQTEKLQFLSNHDSMTHIPNRRFFKERVEQLISGNTQVVIVMFDVDYFKNYNDSYGHQAGDEVLRTIADILQENMQESDIVGRYGGEEFIICLRNPKSMEDVKRVVERFRRKVERYQFPGEEKQPNQKLTISLGVSSVSSGKSMDQLIEEADQALYQAKGKGRNRVEKY